MASRELLDDLFPPSLASMQSFQHIVKDSAFILQHATEVLGETGAKVVVEMAVADNDTMCWLGHLPLPLSWVASVE